MLQTCGMSASLFHGARRTHAYPCIAFVAGYFAPVSDAKAIAGLITSSYLNVLLLSIPFGFAAHFCGWPALLRFGLVSTPARSAQGL